MVGLESISDRPCSLYVENYIHTAIYKCIEIKTPYQHIRTKRKTFSKKDGHQSNI